MMRTRLRHPIAPDAGFWWCARMDDGAAFVIPSKDWGRKQHGADLASKADWGKGRVPCDGSRAFGRLDELQRRPKEEEAVA